MAVKLTDLRNDIDAIVTRLRRDRTDGDILVSEAIGKVRTELGSSLATLNDQLLDIALRKLIHDVGGRKRLGHGPSGVAELFGRYAGVPVMITIGRCRKRDTTKATFEEADIWLRSRERDDKEVKDKNEKFRRMVEELRPYVQAPTDTLEDAAHRRSEAEASGG